ncbi:MAG: response regulator [Alphaproteobacteria bacterium]|nr:response regulator [Alphaproteobacteria bacterium]
MASADSARVLIVDDEPEAIATLAKFLTSRGFVTDTASNGAEAYDCVMAHAFDVVMTDLRMPGMDGADFLARMRVERPEMPVVVMTGHTALDDDERVWARAGVAAVLHKPLNLREVSDILRALAS